MPDGKKRNTAVRMEMDRRDLLKIGAAGLGLAALSACTPGDDGAGKPRIHRTDLGTAPEDPFATPPMDLVRIGFVGVGGMGVGVGVSCAHPNTNQIHTIVF